MRQAVKKEIGPKIYCFLLYKVETLALRLSILWLWNTRQEFAKKRRFFRDFRGNLMFETDIVYGDRPITPRATFACVLTIPEGWHIIDR
jgi:hypothetical protein